MAMSKAQQRAQNKWISKAYDRINLTVPKGERDKIQADAMSMGESANEFIRRAIDEAMARDAQKADSRGAGDMEKQGESR